MHYVCCLRLVKRKEGGGGDTKYVYFSKKSDSLVKIFFGDSSYFKMEGLFTVSTFCILEVS